MPEAFAHRTKFAKSGGLDLSKYEGRQSKGNHGRAQKHGRDIHGGSVRKRMNASTVTRTPQHNHSGNQLSDAPFSSSARPPQRSAVQLSPHQEIYVAAGQM